MSHPAGTGKPKNKGLGFIIAAMVIGIIALVGGALKVSSSKKVANNDRKPVDESAAAAKKESTATPKFESVAKDFTVVVNKNDHPVGVPAYGKVSLRTHNTKLEWVELFYLSGSRKWRIEWIEKDKVWVERVWDSEKKSWSKEWKPLAGELSGTMSAEPEKLLVNGSHEEKVFITVK